MKIVKSVIFASALCASAFSLSGCSTTANSQPTTSSETAPGAQVGQTTPSVDQWSGKVGQKCTIYLAQKVNGNVVSASGVLKSATNDWVVVSGEGSRGIGREAVRVKSDYYVPVSNIGYVDFSEELGKVFPTEPKKN